MSPKISAALAERIEQAGLAEQLDVVVELEGGASKIDDVSAAKQKFARVATPVIQGIEGLGGDVANRAWINHTLRVRLFVEGIPAASQLDGVLAIDVAQMIGNDAVHEPGDELLSDLRYMEPSTAASTASMVRSWRNMPREEFLEFAGNL